jgi:hypothetical protein
MSEQKLKFAIPHPIHQQTSADLWHGPILVFGRPEASP